MKRGLTGRRGAVGCRDPLHAGRRTDLGPGHATAKKGHGPRNRRHQRESPHRNERDAGSQDAAAMSGGHGGRV